MTASRQRTVYTVQQQEREERQQWQTKFQNVCRCFLFLASTREKLLKARQGVEWKLHTHRHEHTHTYTQTNTVRETSRQANGDTAAPRSTHAAYAQYPGQRLRQRQTTASAYANAFLARAKRRTKRFDNLQTGASQQKERQTSRQPDRQTGREREREERVAEAGDTFGCRCGNYNLPSCMRLIKACNASQAKRGPGSFSKLPFASHRD